MQRFSDRTVLVTGAASGIGRAVAQRIAREAGNVFCVDVNSELLQETVGLISYMRTDSTNLSKDCLDDINKYLSEKHPKYKYEATRIYSK